MARNSNPVIRELVDMTKRHGWHGAVLLFFSDDGVRYGVHSAGPDRVRCGLTQIPGDDVFRLVEQGKIRAPVFAPKGDTE